MANKPVIKINSNPNPAPAKGSYKLSTEAVRDRAERNSEVHEHYGITPKKEVVKVNSNPKPVSEEYKFKQNVAAWERAQGSVTFDKTQGKAMPSKQTIKINTNPVPTRTSGLSGVSGKLGGQHAGGHGASLGGMSGMDLGGGGSFSRENM